MLDVSPEEITEGNLLRALLVLAVPLVAQNVVQVVQQVVDIIFLGRLSDDAVAAVGLAAPLVGLLFVVLIVSYVGTQIVVSRRVGGDDESGARRAFVTGLAVAVALGVVAGAVGFLAARPVVELLTAVRPDARGGFVGLAGSSGWRRSTSPCSRSGSPCSR